MDIKRVKGKILKNQVRLPNEYKEVEYVESTGTQYIDTQFVPNQDTRTIVSAQIPTQPTSATAIFGVRQDGSDDYRVYYKYSTDTLQLQYGETGVSTNFPYTSNIIKIDLNKNDLYINDVLKCSGVYKTITTDRSMLLFMSQANVVEWLNAGSVRIYDCEIYDNTTKVRSLVPCYRLSDNAIGLFDTLNSGKNKLDLANIVARNSNVSLKKSNGNVTITNNNSYAINGLNGSDITLEAGTYTVSIAEPVDYSIAIYNSATDRWISNGVYHGNTSGTFTLSETTRIYLNILLASGISTTIKHIQLEKSSSATTYEPYPFYRNIGSGSFTKGADKPELKAQSVSVSAVNYDNLLSSYIVDKFKLNLLS